MSYSTYFLFVLCIFFVACIALVKNRLKYKKGFMFYVSSLAMVPIFIAAACGLFTGLYGMIHFIWGAVVILLSATISYEIITKMLQKPLNEIIDAIEALSEGDVEVSINEKYLKKEHEFAKIMHKLIMLAGSFKKIAKFADNVGKGDLHQDYELLGERDIMGKAMLEMRSNLQNAETEAQKRQKDDDNNRWANQGLAKFADILRKDNDNIENLSYNVISNLVKYVDANQGGLFLLNDAENEQERYLDMKACFAYDNKKYIQKQVQLGEGLIGTCFFEGEPVYLTEIPDDYIKITSGLGGANPTAILLSPLKVNKDIFGVIELASFNEFEPYQLDFIEKVCESIASTIGTVKVNIRTNQLLEQTKLQAEEMASQEEELRQNMEEMQATHEEMRRRETELQNTLDEMNLIKNTAEEKEYEMKQFHDAVFDSCNIIEYSKEGFVTDVNKGVLALFGIDDRSFFTGKHLSEVVGQKNFDVIWNNLLRGKMYESRESLEVNGNTVYTRERYIPICDRNKRLLNVISLVFLENE